MSQSLFYQRIFIYPTNSSRVFHSRLRSTLGVKLLIVYGIRRVRYTLFAIPASINLVVM